MKIKRIDNVSWVSLATYKKNDRPMIQRPFRDLTRLVATDGHRLHMLDGLSEVEKSHIVGDVLGDYTFPDYQQVLPNGSSHKTIGKGVVLSVPLFEQLSAAVAFNKKLKNGCLVVIEPIENEDAKISIQLRFNRNHTIPESSILIDPQYLLDALLAGGSFDISHGGGLTPVVLTRDNLTAVIMPMRHE